MKPNAYYFAGSLATRVASRWLLCCAVVAVSLSFADSAHAASTVLSDCLDNLGTPTTTEVTNACQQQPGCTGTFTWGTGSCYYTTSFTPGSQGAWVPIQTDQTVHDCCSSTTCGSVQKTLTVSGSSTGTVSGSISGSVSQTVQAGINTGLASATSGLTVEVGFTAGASTSSTVDKSDTDTFTSATPACGKKIYYYVMFAADRPATGTLELRLRITCVDGGCDPNPSAGLLLDSDTSDLTLTGSEKARKFTECDLECPGPYDDPPENACQESATSTGTCDYNNYP